MIKPSVLCNDLDGATQAQFLAAIGLPPVTRAALMPDAHLGSSVPIGSVIELEKHICPSWVGYDIGCGVYAYRTSLDIKDLPPVILESIRDYMSDSLPRRDHEVPYDWKLSDRIENMLTPKGRDIYDARGGEYQLGSIGSGNHFVDLSVDSSGTIWIVIHSGSRGFGHGIGDYYMKNFPLLIPVKDSQDYRKDAFAAVMYADYNREILMKIVVSCIQQVTRTGLFIDHSMSAMAVHNYYHGDIYNDKFLHFKGAIHAQKDQLKAIPLNMGDGTVLVRGLENPEYLGAASHGAGREMSRSQAKKSVDMELFEDHMKDILIPEGSLSRFIDEAPEAYKDGYSVISQQEGVLFNKVDHLKPLIVIKG